MTHFYLASQSPRRRELLAQIGAQFTVISSGVEEQRQSGESPSDYSARLAQEKAQAGARQYSDKPVLGADTIVVLDGQVLEKPASQQQGGEMLLRLSGQTHQVMTSVCVVFGDKSLRRLVATEVRFREIDASEAERYWHSGEPQDKAGGYAIQGLGAVFVEEIKGSYSAVVGLPLLETAQLLAACSIPVWCP